MSAPKAGAIITVFPHIHPTASVTPKSFLSFYTTNHIPDITSTPGFISAAVYESPKNPKPYLFVYHVTNPAVMESAELHAKFEKEDVVAMRGNARYEIRMYEPFKTEEVEGDGKVWEGLALFEDYKGGEDVWKVLEEIEGGRTRQYRLLHTEERGEGADPNPTRPEWLLMHEFDWEDDALKEGASAYTLIASFKNDALTER